MTIQVITEACGCCGCQISPPGAFHPTFAHGEEVQCTMCGAINTMMVDPEDGSASVGAWVCEHGKGCDEPCDLCDTEAGVEG